MPSETTPREANEAAGLPSHWLNAELEEEKFLRSRIKLTGGLLRNVFVCALPICLVLAGHGFLHGHIDIGPSVGCFLLLLLVPIHHLRPHSYSLRQVCALGATVYLNMRLIPWHLLISWWPLLPIVKQGYPIPYALLAPSMLLLAGSSIGLRIIPDLLPGATSSSVCGIIHLFSTHNERTMAVCHTGAQLVAFLCTGVALHHFESLQRNWFRYAEVETDTGDSKWTVRWDVAFDDPAEDEARFAQDLLECPCWSVGKLDVVATFIMPAISALTAYYYLAGSFPNGFVFTGWTPTRLLLPGSVVVAAQCVMMGLAFYPDSTQLHKKRRRHALLVAFSFIQNVRILTFTPSVSKALAVQPAPLAFPQFSPLAMYPAGIHPLPAAIIGPQLVLAFGGGIGLQLADTAPWAVATTIVGCWHLYEVMSRCPFSRANYIGLTVIATLVGMWAYSSMAYGLRRAWLRKKQAGRIEPPVLATSQVRRTQALTASGMPFVRHLP